MTRDDDCTGRWRDEDGQHVEGEKKGEREDREVEKAGRHGEGTWTGCVERRGREGVGEGDDGARALFRGMIYLKGVVDGSAGRAFMWV